MVDVTGLLMFIRWRMILSVSVIVTPLGRLIAQIIVLFVVVIAALVEMPSMVPFSDILQIAT